jgi:hypothetical protein
MIATVRRAMLCMKEPGIQSEKDCGSLLLLLIIEVG